jgi:hypothetical protein
MRVFAPLLVLTILAGTSGAATPITDEQITTALNERTLRYENGHIQTFLSSGETVYTAGQPSWGRWHARGGRYCSQWPPSDNWYCYDVKLEENGVRFTDAVGDHSDGVYINP